MSRRFKRIAIGASGAVIARLLWRGAALWWLTREEPDLPVSAESGRQYFRHKDFDPLRDGHSLCSGRGGLAAYPEELGGNRDEFCRKFGAIIDPDDRDGLPIGFSGIAIVSRERTFS